MKKVVALLINDVHLNKDNGSLVKDILNTDGVSTIKDNNGKSYWWNTIDKTKKYRDHFIVDG